MLKPSIRGLAIIGSLMAIAAPSNGIAVESRDPFVADWSGQCGDHVQCVLSISRAGEKYDAALRISKWNDNAQVLCMINGRLVHGDKSYIAGTMGSSHLVGVFLRQAGEVEVHGIAEDACKLPYALNGVYTAIGH